MKSLKWKGAQARERPGFERCETEAAIKAGNKSGARESFGKTRGRRQGKVM